MANFAHPAGRARAAAAVAAAAGAEPKTLRGFFGVFRYSRRALELVWGTNPGLTVALAVLTLIAGILPAGVAYIGSLIVDAVVAALKRRGATRHLALPVAPAGAAWAARQRDDPREGVDARAATLRGLGVLRQIDAGATRGLEPAAVARHAHLRTGAERHLARKLRDAARALLAVGCGRVAARRPTGVHRRGQILRRRIPPISLALARDSHADLP